MLHKARGALILVSRVIQFTLLLAAWKIQHLNLILNRRRLNRDSMACLMKLLRHLQRNKTLIDCILQVTSAVVLKIYPQFVHFSFARRRLKGVLILADCLIRQWGTKIGGGGGFVFLGRGLSVCLRCPARISEPQVPNPASANLRLR